MSKRVVVTGMSVNTAIGDTLDGFRDALMAGRSAISQWKAFPTDRVYSKVGGDLSAYDVDGQAGVAAAAHAGRRAQAPAQARREGAVDDEAVDAAGGRRLARRRAVRRRLRSASPGGGRRGPQPQRALSVQQPRRSSRRSPTSSTA